MEKTLCIVQARMGSSRLPGKVLKDLGGMPSLAYELKRLQLAEGLSKIVIATSEKSADDEIARVGRQFEVDVFRGSEEDVLDRFYKCSLQYPDYEVIVRVSGDCPLIDPWLIDKTLRLFKEKDCDYVNNITSPAFPKGVEVEVFTRKSLKESAQQARLPSEREHVTQYIRKSDTYKKDALVAPSEMGNYRFVLDHPEDYEVIRFLVNNSKIDDDYNVFVKLLQENPDIHKKNKHIDREEGLKKTLQEDIEFLKNID